MWRPTEGTLLPGGVTLECFKVTGTPTTDWTASTTQGQREEEQEVNRTVWTEWPCQSTKTLLLHFNPTSQRKSSLLKWTACPLVFKESERNKRETGTKSLRDDGEKKRAKTVSWLRELYHICKPSGTLHKLISLCIVVTVLCRYHLCFCKIIYSAKMVLFFLFFFFQSLCNSTCVEVLTALSLFSRVTCKNKSCLYFFLASTLNVNTPRNTIYKWLSYCLEGRLNTMVNAVHTHTHTRIHYTQLDIH